jgi:dTDP-4-dehydrorhamnose 3,5-epimerase
MSAGSMPRAGKFTVRETPLEGVLLLEPRVFGDSRGFFLESYNRAELAAAGIEAEFVQDNHSRSARNVLRGLHYQARRPQGKLVRVASGEIFDVAVDLRRGSPSFGRWFGETLSEENKRMLWIPPGLAHGFLVTSDSADVLYKATEYYAPEDEVSLRWDDPAIGIRWPLQGEPIVSAKDRQGLAFSEAPKFD